MEEPLSYEVVIAIDPRRIEREQFIARTRQRLQVFADAGVSHRVHLWVVETNGALDMEVFIADKTSAQISFSTARTRGGPEALQHAILFEHRPQLCSDLAEWFDNRVKPQAIEFEEWLKRKTIILTIDGDRANFLSPQEPLFGPEVASKFPTEAAGEIRDAGKCFALEMHIACVFHLMRTMEFGLEAVRLCLKLSDPVKKGDRTWGKILERIDEEIKRRNSANPTGWLIAEDAALFQEIHASLTAVKDAWRNPTMHVERTYTSEQARHLYWIVRGFMQNVVSRMDENGKPFA